MFLGSRTNLEAQSGKSMTAEEAATLIRLAASL